MYFFSNFRKKQYLGKEQYSHMLKIQTSKKALLETSIAGKWTLFTFHASSFFLSAETICLTTLQCLCVILLDPDLRKISSLVVLFFRLFVCLFVFTSKQANITRKDYLNLTLRQALYRLGETYYMQSWASNTCG